MWVQSVGSRLARMLGPVSASVVARWLVLVQFCCPMLHPGRFLPAFRPGRSVPVKRLKLSQMNVEKGLPVEDPGRGEHLQMLDAQQPSVTVTFVGWMRQEMLQKGIESVLSLPDDAIEIIVVDNSPSDHSLYEWLLKAYPMVKAVKTFSPLPLPMVRNLLVASARGKYVVFHDDDSRFAEHTDLASAVEYLDA